MSDNKKKSNTYKDSLNLPHTDFPMRGNLVEREPERLAEMVAKYAEYSESVGVIDVGPDFDPVSVIAGGQ